MDELRFLQFSSRPTPVLRFDDGSKIYLRHPEFKLKWNKIRTVHEFDGGRRVPILRGHRMEVRMQWSMMPTARLVGGGQDREIPGHLALLFADEQNHFLFSKTGSDPWVRVYPVNTQQTEYTAGDAVPEGEALYRSQELVVPSVLEIGWGSSL